MAKLIVDYWRQLKLFSPEKFGDEEVNIIGCGAIGSYVAFLLAKMGVKNLHLWDFDFVEPHNLPNQLFRLKDIGRPKVEALSEIIQEIVEIKPTIHNEAVTETTKLKGVVFLLVDSMDVRGAIWKGSLKLKLPVKLMVETRMAIDNGRVYTIKPCSPGDIRFWEGTLYPDSEAEESACTNRSVGPTVAYISSLAAWKLIKWFNREEYSRELIISCRPSIVIAE